MPFVQIEGQSSDVTSRYVGYLTEFFLTIICIFTRHACDRAGGARLYKIVVSKLAARGVCKQNDSQATQRIAF